MTESNDVRGKTEINDDKRADILMKLNEVAWTNFNHRRGYEWKVSLSIWRRIKGVRN